MNNNKKFRIDLFIHLDGIALIAPLACLFKTDYKKIKDLKSGNNATIKISELYTHNINGDYLNVTFRLFESQGWITRKWINNQELSIEPTKYGKEIFNEISIYEKFFPWYKNLSELSFSNLNEYQKLNKLLNTYNNLNIENKIILKHIEGLILGPVLVSLFLNKQAKITDNKLILSKKISLENKHFIINLFKQLELVDKELNLTEKGIFFCKRSSAYGVTVSYMPLFSKMQTLLFGNTSNILNRDQNGNELHVNRKMNVWGSGGAHKLYFKKIDEIIIEIFNYPIKKQPIGIADMGCGDGTMLIHLYNLIKNKTLRGQMLDTYPLHVIGADFNEEALDVTHENLNSENISHILIQADIGNPDDFNKELEKSHNIKLNELLNVRSFLDHNRVFEMPNINNFDLSNISINSTAAFCANDNNNKILNPIIFKLSLIEHFKKWKPHINKFGLILLELHTIEPALCSKNIGNTLATAYDATHGYSNQYIIEYEEFVNAAIIAGLKFEEKFEFNFPNKELTTVSINLISS